MNNKVGLFVFTMLIEDVFKAMNQNGNSSKVRCVFLLVRHKLRAVLDCFPAIDIEGVTREVIHLTGIIT
jgi:hypothetical protein